MTYIISMICFVAWVVMLDRAERIKKSKFWPVAYFLHIFLACQWGGVFFKAIGV